MTPINMTTEELERWHYANGDLASAALYGRVVDGDEELRDDLAHAEVDREQAERERDNALGDLRDAEERIGDLEMKVDDLERQLQENPHA